MKTVWRVFVYLKRYPWLALATLACAITGTLTVIIFPAVTKRIIDEVSSVERVLIDGIEQGVVAALQVVIVLGVMFYLSWKLALLALAPLPLLAGGALWYTLTAHRRYRLQRRAASAMNSLLHDN